MLEFDTRLVIVLALGFTLASIFGFIAQKLKLPTLLGYLLAGYVIGPNFPIYIADIAISEQLAEIGVILMLFSVGIHFRLEDLLHVKRIAIPGAIIQTAASATAATYTVHFLGWPVMAGVIIGLAIGVASTVVLVRVLTDNQILETPQGHIAIGWLIVEDILTVAVLLLLPLLAALSDGKTISFLHISQVVGLLLIKFVVLTALMFTWGYRLISYVLSHVARVRSQELFTLAMFACIFFVTAVAAYIFGMSVALGAFIAGIVIGKTSVRHQAASNALPLRDIFSIVFFLSVGMLFDPKIIALNLSLFFDILAIVLLVKPLVAFLLVLAFGMPFNVALTVAVALAQIGEFSFILAEEALSLKLLEEVAYDIIVVSALISIALNPLLFKLVPHLEALLVKMRFLQNFSKNRCEKFSRSLTRFFDGESGGRVLVVGYGPIGQEVVDFLKASGLKSLTIEQNVDTVVEAQKGGVPMMYGDASEINILQDARIQQARLLIITVPKMSAALNIISAARYLKHDIEILVRISYAVDHSLMEALRVHAICAENEMGKAFKKFLAQFFAAP